MAQAPDVISELTADHRGVQRLFDDIRSSSPGSAKRKELVDQVTQELVRHTVAEKEYLYPAVRHHVTDGERLAGKEVADLAEIEKTLQALISKAPDEQDFTRLLLRLITQVTDHVLIEEQTVYPKLRAACSAETLRELGQKVRRAKKIAPTQPHPHLPDTPQAAKLVSPGVGLIDRIRDLAPRRGKH
ncbi:hemerythrin domain-containing protein [Streptomyces sp. NPDC020096]